MPERFTNILIIKPSSLGDIVLALPALTALRESFPRARITWLVRPEFAPLLEKHAHLDEVMHFDRKLLGKAWCNPRAAGQLYSLITSLSRAEFDAVFDFQGLLRTAFFACCTHSQHRYGMACAREFARFAYTRKIEQTSDTIHLVDYYLDIVAAATGRTTAAEFILPADPAAEQSALRLLADRRIWPESYAVLIPGSAHRKKCWPAENFAEIARRIHSDSDLRIVTVGTNSDLPATEKVSRLADVPITDLAGLTDLPQLLAVLKNARCVVANDTGPAHIAAALGKPLVIIFGRVNPARLAPYKRPHTVAAIDPFSRPPKIRNRNPKYDVTAVTPRLVYEKLRAQLQNPTDG